MVTAALGGSIEVPTLSGQLTKLKIYAGSDHPHTAQNPQVIELGKLNSKNLVRN